MDWLGKADIGFVHAATPREIPTTDGDMTDLLKICREVTPSCNLNPLLPNGHFQTLWTATKPRGPPIYYKRKVFESDEEIHRGTFAVDFVVEPLEEDPTLFRRVAYFSDQELANMKSHDENPMLIVLHGLCGGSHEVYLRHCISPLIRTGGWEVCVVNSRGCARSAATGGKLFHARGTWDLRQTIKWLAETFPNRPLFGLGFSLGANILTNYCGEEGNACPLKAAISCSNPFNLEIASRKLQNSLFGKHIYLRAMGKAMKMLADNQVSELQQHTNLNASSLESVTFLQDFDRVVQCPAWGYPTETAYYRDSSSSDAVLAISIPFFAIAAIDDPIAVKEALPVEEFKQNPNTVLMTTSLGGHLGWYEIGGNRWYTRPVCNFLNYMVNKVDLGKIEHSPLPGLVALSDFAYYPLRRKFTRIDKELENNK